MYLHLGQKTVAALEEVVGIFDFDDATSSNATMQFLRKAEEEGKVVVISDGLPKSFVICQDKKKSVTVYFSQIAPSTLLKRANFMERLSAMR